MIMRAFLTILAFALLPLPAFAQDPSPQNGDDEAKVKAVITNWYERVGQFKADAPWVLMAPGSIDGGPGYSEPADLNSGSAAIRGPWLNNELAAKAMKFAYDIDVLTVDEHLAKARVWERGYFYAWAAQKTYEMAASTLFVFEKQDNGEWKILAHQANSIGIPPNKITSPMPDLHDEYYANAGKGRDPVADAAAAKNF
jgi:hypothetical protein